MLLRRSIQTAFDAFHVSSNSCCLILNSGRIGASAFTPLSFQLNSARAALSTTANQHRIPGIRSKHPLDRKWLFKAAGIQLNDPSKYTAEALPYVRNGGRAPDGKVFLKHEAGGLKRPYFMVDGKRGSVNNPPANDNDVGGVMREYRERVLLVHETWWRHHFIALVANDTHKRWIIATTNMAAGDIITSHAGIPPVPITNPKPGDAYPIGALPVGTQVCCIELIPGRGHEKCTTAGASAIFSRRDPIDMLTGGGGDDDDGATGSYEGRGACYVRLAHKRELRLSPLCSVVVGQVSHENHKFEKYSKWGEKAWEGFKQRSGLKQTKGGRFGRKIRPVKQPLDYVTVASESSEKSKKSHKFIYSKHGEPTGKKQPGTMDNPRNVHRFPNEISPDGEVLQPRFRWCSWTSVR